MSSRALLIGLAAIATAFAVWNRRPWWWAAYGTLSLSFWGPVIGAEFREEGLVSAAAIVLLYGSVALAVGFYLRSAIARGRAEQELDGVSATGI